MRNRLILLSVLGLLLPGAALAKKKKKGAVEAPPPVGWFAEVPVGAEVGGWAHQCYYPPDFAALGDGARSIERARVLDELMTQWSGKRDDGVEFKDTYVEDVEITLLGRPQQIERIAIKNLEYCKASATSGGQTGDWAAWFKELPTKLTAGECLTPFDYTMFDYLDIFTDWQRDVTVCQGDKLRISASSNDKYQVRKNGPWINASGDQDSPTGGNTSFPCNQEGCYEGMFFARFVTESGVETVLPVGVELVFQAPEHGTISYRINDTEYFDNKWFKTGGIEDHTSIELSPHD